MKYTIIILCRDIILKQIRVVIEQKCSKEGQFVRCFDHRVKMSH